MEKSFRDPFNVGIFQLYVLDDKDNKILIASNSDLNRIFNLAKNLWVLSENDYWIYLDRESDVIPIVKFFA